MTQFLGAGSSVFTTTNVTPILPTNAAAASVSQHHRILGSMGETKRRLSDARDVCVQCTFLFLSLVCLLSLPLSFFWVCFLCVLQPAWLSVPGVLGLCFLWIAFLLFNPFFPCLFLRCHSRMTCVLLLCFVSPPFPPIMFGFLTFV